METIRSAFIRPLCAACAIAVLLAGCQSRATALPEVPPADQPAPSIPTAIPLPTPVAPIATARPDPTAATELEGQSEAQTAASEPLVEQPSLLDLQQGDQLELVADLAIPRSDFGVRLAFSPNGQLLLHSGAGLAIQRFDLLHNQPMDDLLGFELMSPLTISVSSDGAVVAADDGSQVRLWNSQTGQLTSALPLPPISALASAGFHGNRLYYTVDFNGNVLVWDPQSWGQLTQFSYSGRVEAAVLYPNGEALALQDRDRNLISVFDIDGSPVHTVSFEGTNPRLLSVSPDGSRFLLHLNYGSPEEGVAVISAETGRPELKLDLLNFRHFAVSFNWTLLAAVGVDNELRLYSLPEGRLVLSQPLEVARTMSLQMSPSAQYLGLFAIKQPGQGGAIQVWGAGTGG